MQDSKAKEQGEKAEVTVTPTPTSEATNDSGGPANSPMTEATPATNENNLNYLTTSLQDEPAYDEAQVQSITIQQGNNNYVVPKTREYVILQSLYWLDLSIAKATEQAINKGDVLIYINGGDHIFAIPYDLGSNTFRLGENSYYATEQVARLMAGLFSPESELARIDTIFTIAEEEHAATSNRVDESFRYDLEQLKVQGMDFHQWKRYLAKDSSGEAIAHYFDDGSDTVSVIQYFEHKAIVFEREIVLIDDSVETKDGIKIGLSKEEVLDSLGKANLETETHWSYLIGDYLKFHLYFDNNKVAYIKLTLPL